MPPIGNPSDKSVEQRRLAEERSRLQSITTAVPLSEADARQLVHELQVHQIELEMQIEELSASRAEIEAGLARYTDFYDFAPVGYFTLDRVGTISQLNLAGARLLRTERSQLLGSRFGFFVAATDRLVFNAMLAQVFATETWSSQRGASPSLANPSCEVSLECEGQPSQTVQIEATLSTNSQTCRVVVPDGTERIVHEESDTTCDEQTGQPIRMTGTIQDITARKQAEQTLKRTADRLSALLAIAQTLVDTLDLDTLLNQLLRHLTGVIAVNNRSAIFIYDPQAKVLVPRACIPADSENYRRIRLLPGESISGKVFQSGRSVLLRNQQEIDTLRGELQPENERLLAKTGSGHFVCSTICVPLRTRSGEIIGTMTLGSTHGTFTEEDLSLLEGVAAQAAMAIQNAALFDEVHAGRERLQVLSRQLIATQETERRHLARELHDEIGQALTGIKLHLKALQHPDQVQVRSSLVQETIAVVDQTVNQVRNLALDLRPSMLDDIGLVAALRWCLDRQAQRAGFGTHFHAEPSDVTTSSEIATACFRVAPESLTNVARHARAKNVRVELRQSDSELELIVSDDGIGFDVSASRIRAIGGASIGLLGMTERVQLVGGQIEITSEPSKGTTIHARFPTTTQSARGRA